jgi:DNA translocase FtsK
MKKNKVYFFPQAFRTFFQARTAEAFGLLLLFGAAYLFLALLSYDASDHSFNTVSTISGYSNVFEANGASIADVLLQYIGKASYLFAIILSLWGFIFLAHHQLQRPLQKLLFLFLAVGFCAFCLAFMALALGDDSMGSLFNIAALQIAHLLDKADFKILGYSGLKLSLAGLCLIISGFFIYAAAGLRLHQWGKFILILYRALQKTISGSLWVYRKWKAYADLRPKVQDLSAPLPDITDQHHLQTLNDGAFYTSPPAHNLTNQYDAAQGDEAFIAPSPAPLSKATASRNKMAKPIALNDAHGYALPPLDLLQPADNKGRQSAIRKADLEENIARLAQVLQDYGIKGQIIGARPGPVVTLYELEPAPGIKSARVIGLADDIARSMSAISARIAVVPGKNVIGIELPNEARQTVFLKELLEHSDFENTAAKLTMSLGKNIAGTPIYTDLARMPHMIVAGTTGSGKSVAVNAMILSLLYRHSPETCRLLLIDPKMLEFSMYNDIPHLLSPVVTEPKKAIFALKWAVREMEDRYRAMSHLGVRNIENYNNVLKKALAEGRELKRTVQTGFDPDTGRPTYEEQAISPKPLPYIVIVVDEMADLMMVAGKDIEAAVQRLAQMARAAGIHVIMATQRPSVDVITGTIKANFPTRISFQVTSRFDSRTILGEQGAEQLLGRGDMLFMEAGGKIQRIHGPFVSDDEVDRVVQFLKSQGNPEYIDTITDESSDLSLPLGGAEEDGDDLYRQAVQIVKTDRKASTSYIQRRLQIGYNRAARIIEQMEADGVVSPANHVGKREILIEKAG